MNPMDATTVTPSAATSHADPERWVDDHGDCLYRYALTRVRKEELAQDLVQETLLVAVRTETTGKPSLIGVGTRLDPTPQYTIEKKYWPDLVARMALGVQASQTGRCIQARLPFEDVLVELRRYQEGAGRRRPEGMAVVLGFTQTITSHLTRCDLQVGDPEALLRHLCRD